MAAERTSGTVKWFSRVKGYGFIAPDGEESEIFVHFTGIEGEGYRNLEKGEKVSFVVEDTEKGPQAVQVRAEGFDVTSWTAEPTDDPAEGVVGETSWRAPGADEALVSDEEPSDEPAEDMDEASGSDEEASDEPVQDMDEASGSEEEASDEPVQDMDEASGSDEEASDEPAEEMDEASESDEESGDDPPDLVA